MLPYHIEELIAHWKEELQWAVDHEDREFKSFCERKINYYETLLEEFN